MIRRADGREFLVIDCHTHMGISAVMERFGWDRTFLGDEMIRSMDAAGVDAVCSFPLGACNTDYSQMNGRILDDAKRLAGRIFPFARIHPLFEQTNADHIRAFVQRGLRGIKFHPFVDGAYPANDPSLIYPLMEEIRRHNLVVLFHSGEAWNATPGLIGEVARDFPDVQIIIAHMGMYGFHTEAIGIARRLENVYLETSFLYPPAVLKVACRAIGKERVLYGTDHPVVPFLFEVDKVMKYAGLNDDEIAAILGENAARLLGANPEALKAAARARAAVAG